ncbi:MAG: cysteine hydrolase, partial [Deltaproteobacteria bacterium]|nr:cysteine hydrolase [Deltaproteobacteria bacterium]
LLIIDMVKDNFREERNLPITALARKIIPRINHLISIFRQECWPVVFSTDAFQRDDFIFSSSMKPHSLAGTEGAEIIDELGRREGDLWLPKPRFSAFFRTDLAQWLRDRKVTLCVVSGIATPFCVLSTVMDALCHDFKAIVLEDCTTAGSNDIHKQTLNIYRRNPIYPLLKILTASKLMEKLSFRSKTSLQNKKGKGG